RRKPAGKRLAGRFPRALLFVDDTTKKAGGQSQKPPICASLCSIARKCGMMVGRIAKVKGEFLRVIRDGRRDGFCADRAAWGIFSPHNP
ncbi:MAG: hypothetical protein RR739_01150, partial [Clostridia bacterium]